ncbi:MAG: gamma-glutamyl-gamma-aminobutyrate hydrolase family protein [Chloroflexi bacterium]|nr:gamma-glutamyl-gamma-aminobutyrate hydrolase family protein [Chloroflexota bacterium]
MPPLIGITIHPAAAPDRDVLDTLLDSIVQCVERAGGLPLLIPLGLSEPTLRALYARLVGLLLSGGGDLDPARYHAGPHPAVGGVDVERDRVELILAQWAAADTEDKALFGICRGTQVFNVALGGTLYRDIGEHPGAQKHTFYPGLPFDYRSHEVKVEEDTVLAHTLGLPVLTVNSLHHQAVRHVAPGLRVAARAPDGLVEAVEIPGRLFAVAVQWHPESLPDAPEMRRLFEAFVQAASR